MAARRAWVVASAAPVGTSTAFHVAVGIEAISSKYALTQAIGTGAMGTVYEATQLSLRRRVAIKVLHPQYTENAAIIKRFFREALAVSHLRSRYVVRVFDSDVSPAGAPFIVMDRLEGCDLAARLRQGSIETTTVVDWTIQVCSAMNEAHRRGIVRRDLKPSNLFLVGDGTIRVLDFGISKFTEAGVLTAGSQILGTPAYIAPEVLRGHQATAQSDLWAIGVIAYKALSGHLPCEAERPDATGIAAMFATLSMPVTPLRHYRPDLPEGLCNAIMKGLVKDPEHRYLSAKDLAIELVPFGSNAEYFEDLTDDELGRSIRDSSAAVPPFADRDGAMARWPRVLRTTKRQPSPPPHLRSRSLATLPRAPVRRSPRAPSLRDSAPWASWSSS